MYNFSIDKRVFYVIIAIIVLTGLINLMNNPSLLFNELASIPGVLIAITFHEFAHSYAAYKLGDNTSKNEGRMSLNPLAHIDPIGFLMLLFAGFGWGKPVNVDPRNYTRKISMEKGEAIVSIAGPIMNIFLAFIFTLIYAAIYAFTSKAFIDSTTGTVILYLIFYTISINVGLGVFNLIPLPPLDGYKVIMPLLPYKAKTWFKENEQIFYLVFIVLWITGIASIIISPAISWITNGFLKIGGKIFL